MSNANYPLWYGLPRGVELRQDGKPAAEQKESGGISLPWTVQFIGLLLPMLAGLGLIGLYFVMARSHPVTDALFYRLVASEAGFRIALLAEAELDYLIPCGAALLACGVYLGLRTRCLRQLGEADRFTKALAFVYLAPGSILAVFVGGAVVVMTGLLLFYVALFVIIGALMLLGALFSAGS